jgi:hypothetical protein
VFIWCVLELLAESIDAEKPEHAALDLFDRLRLREPLAHSFLALGFKGRKAGARQPESRLPCWLNLECTRLRLPVPRPRPKKQKQYQLTASWHRQSLQVLLRPKCQGSRSELPRLSPYPAARRRCPLANRRTRGTRAYLFHQGVL